MSSPALDADELLSALLVDVEPETTDATGWFLLPFSVDFSAPCVLALLVEVSTLERGGRGQVPAGQSRMQHPVATPPSSPPLLGSRFPRLLLLRLRLRRHHPHLSRSSSPELSHPSNWPSSGGASPMA